MRSSYQSALKGARRSSPTKKTATTVTVKVSSNASKRHLKGEEDAQSTKRLNDDSKQVSSKDAGNESASETKLDSKKRRAVLGRTPS